MFPAIVLLGMGYSVMIWAAAEDTRMMANKSDFIQKPHS